jgi:predicted O-methyltransferase YrrM
MHLVRLYLRLLLRFFRFYVKARTLYDLHSPFAFELAKRLLEDGRTFYAYSDIEQLREQLLRNPSLIQIDDFGAGSMIRSSSTRTIASICRYSATRPFYGRLLHRLVLWQRPRHILELGTSLGIGTLYLSKAAPPEGQVFTLEGSPEIAEKARAHFHRMEANNVVLIGGRFEATLPTLLEQLPGIDLVYLDGHHQYQATMDYFRQLLRKTGPDSIFVLDDIHWSTEMQNAWKEIQAFPEVCLTVDLFHCGLVFFQPELKVKQHLYLVPLRWKPWRIGLF